jgi:hypothetical protein
VLGGEMNILDDIQFRAQMAQHIASARAEIATALAALNRHRGEWRSTEQHEQEIDAVQGAHAQLIRAASLLAR